MPSLALLCALFGAPMEGCSCGSGDADDGGAGGMDARIDPRIDDGGTDATHDASSDAGPFFARCDASEPCAAPEGVHIFEWVGGTAALPAGYYLEDRSYGCEWVVFRADAEGHVTIETAARGPGWWISAPASFTCVASDCTLSDAPSGLYDFSIETCGGGRGGCAGSGSIHFDLDTVAQLVTLGYGAGPDTGSCPSTCASCD